MRNLCKNCGAEIVYDEGCRSQLNVWAWRHVGSMTRSGSMRRDCYPGVEPGPGEEYVQAEPVPVRESDA